MELHDTTLFLEFLLFLLPIKYFTSLEIAYFDESHYKWIMFPKSKDLTCFYVYMYKFLSFKKDLNYFSQIESWFCSLGLHLAVYEDDRFSYAPHKDLNYVFHCITGIDAPY